LTPTLLALKQLPIINPVRLGMTASRTGKPVRPPDFFEVFETLFFGLKMFLKLKKSYFFVGAHRYPPKMCLSLCREDNILILSLLDKLFLTQNDKRLILKKWLKTSFGPFMEQSRS